MYKRCREEAEAARQVNIFWNDVCVKKIFKAKDEVADWLLVVSSYIGGHRGEDLEAAEDIGAPCKTSA